MTIKIMYTSPRSKKLRYTQLDPIQRTYAYSHVWQFWSSAAFLAEIERAYEDGYVNIISDDNVERPVMSVMWGTQDDLSKRGRTLRLTQEDARLEAAVAADYEEWLTDVAAEFERAAKGVGKFISSGDATKRWKVFVKDNTLIAFDHPAIVGGRDGGGEWDVVTELDIKPVARVAVTDTMREALKQLFDLYDSQQ